MKCYKHLENDAVATCQVCGKGLCKECVDACEGGELLCDACAKAKDDEAFEKAKTEFYKDRGSLIVKPIIGLVLMVLAFIFIREWWCLFAFFLPFGWYTNTKTEGEKTRDAIERASNPFLHLIGELFGFILKLCLCAVLGIPFFIKLLVRHISDIKFIKENNIDI